jgi:predicted aspartyl protease
VGIQRPQLESEVGPSQQKIEYFNTLIDTGATVTCISSIAVRTLNLNSIGLREMVSATDTSPVNVYLTNLIIPFNSEMVVFPNTQVLEFAIGINSPFQLLLGRDVLCKGTFTLSFDGHFTFSL